MPVQETPPDDLFTRTLEQLTAADLAKEMQPLEQSRDENMDDEEKWDAIQCAIDLIKLIGRAKRGSLVLEHAVRQIDDLKKGRAYLGRVGMANGRIQMLVDMLMSRVEQAHAVAVGKQMHTDTRMEVMQSLTGNDASLETEQEQPQPWLNQRQEAAYAELSKELTEVNAIGKGALRLWLVSVFNPILSAGHPPLKPEDIQSLRLANIHVKTASNIAGAKIERPVLIFTNASEYQKFSVALQGKAGMCSRGMRIPSNIFTTEPFATAGLLITINSAEFAKHEIIHSIDPHLGSRDGYNGVLEEALAYYPKTIMENSTKGYDHLANPEDGPWASLAAAIDGYYDHYSSKSKKQIPKKTFGTLCNDLAQGLRDLQKRIGHIETLRLLAQCRTLKEFFNKAAVLPSKILSTLE